MLEVVDVTETTAKCVLVPGQGGRMHYDEREFLVKEWSVVIQGGGEEETIHALHSCPLKSWDEKTSSVFIHRLRPSTTYTATPTLYLLPLFGDLIVEPREIDPISFTTATTPEMFRCIVCATSFLDVAWVSMGEQYAYHAPIEYECELWDSYGVHVASQSTAYNSALFEGLCSGTHYCVRVRSRTVSGSLFGLFSQFRSVTTSFWQFRVLVINPTNVIFEVYRTNKEIPFGPMRPPELPSEFAREGMLSMAITVRKKMEDDTDISLLVGSVQECQEEVDLDTMTCTVLGLASDTEYVACAQITLETTTVESIPKEVPFKTMSYEDSFLTQNLPEMRGLTQSTQKGKTTEPGVSRGHRRIVTKFSHVNNPCTTLRLHNVTETTAVVKWAHGDLRAAVFDMNFSFRLRIMSIPRGQHSVPEWFINPALAETPDGAAGEENVKELKFFGDSPGYKIVSLEPDTRYVVNVAAYDTNAHAWMSWSPSISFATMRLANLLVEHVDLGSLTFTMPPSVLQEEHRQAMSGVKLPTGQTFSFQDYNWQKLQKRLNIMFFLERASEKEFPKTVWEEYPEVLEYQEGRSIVVPCPAGVQSGGRFYVRARFMLHNISSWGRWSDPVHFVCRAVHESRVFTLESGHLAIRWASNVVGQLPRSGRISEEHRASYVNNHENFNGFVFITFEDGTQHDTLWVPMVGNETREAEVIFPPVRTGAYRVQVLMIDRTTSKTGWDAAQTLALFPYTTTFHEFERLQPLVVQASEGEVVVQCIPRNVEGTVVISARELQRIQQYHEKRHVCIRRQYGNAFARLTKRKKTDDFSQIPYSIKKLEDLSEEAERTMKIIAEHNMLKGQTILPDLQHVEVLVCDQITGDTVVSKVLKRDPVKGIIVDGLATHSRYFMSVRPVMMTLSGETFSRGHWSHPLPFMTARRLYICVENIGVTHLELSWHRPLPWLEDSELALSRTMTEPTTLQERGVRRVNIGTIPGSADFRYEKDVVKQHRESHKTGIYSLDMPYEVIIWGSMFPGAQWQILLNPYSPAVFIEGLREGFQYSIRVRQSDGTKKTQWSRCVIVQTLTKIGITMTSLGSNYCSLHCARQLEEPVSPLQPVQARSFMDTQDSDEDVEIDVVTMYEVSVELRHPNTASLALMKEYVPDGIGRGEKSFTFQDLLPGHHYLIRTRVVAQQNLVGPWETVIEFDTVPLVTIQLVQVCEDMAQIRYNRILTPHVTYTDGKRNPSQSIFQIEQMYAVVHGKVLLPRSRQVLKDINVQIAALSETETLVSLNNDEDTCHISALLPDCPYTISAYYVDAKGVSCQPTRPIRFLTLPTCDLQTCVIGETFFILDVKRCNRCRSSEDLMRQEEQRKLTYDALSLEKQAELMALEADYSRGQAFTTSMHNRYQKLLVDLREKEEFLQVGTSPDVAWKLQVSETKLMTFDFIPSRDVIVKTVMNSLTAWSTPCNIQQRFSKDKLQFIVTDLAPDRMYNTLVRATSQSGGEGIPPMLGMWSDMFHQHTLRPIVPVISSISEEWALVVLTKPMASTGLAATTLYQFQINGVVIEFTLFLRPGETRHLLFQGLQPATEYLIETRTAIEEASAHLDTEHLHWSRHKIFLTLRTLPVRPTNLLLYEFRDCHISLAFRTDGVVEKYAETGHQSSQALDAEDESHKEGPPPLVHKHTFHETFCQELEQSLRTKQAILERYAETIEVINYRCPSDSERKVQEKCPSDQEDYYVIEFALATLSPRRSFRHFIPLGCVTCNFARIELPSSDIHVHELQFRVSARNRFVDASIKEAPVDSVLPDDAWRTRSFYSTTVGWQDPDLPPPVSQPRVRVQGSNVEVTWCYPSAKFHNQLYFSVRLQQVDVEAWEEVARVRGFSLSLQGLSNVPYRLWIVPVTTFGSGKVEHYLRFQPRMDLHDRRQRIVEDFCTRLDTNLITPTDWGWVFPNSIEHDYTRLVTPSPFHLRMEGKMEARSKQSGAMLTMPPRMGWLPLRSGSVIYSGHSMRSSPEDEQTEENEGPHKSAERGPHADEEDNTKQISRVVASSHSMKVRFHLPSKEEIRRPTFGEMADRCISCSPGLMWTPGSPSPALTPTPTLSYRKASPRPPTPADSLYAAEASKGAPAPTGRPPLAKTLAVPGTVSGLGHRAIRVKVKCVDPSGTSLSSSSSSVAGATPQPQGEQKQSHQKDGRKPGNPRNSRRGSGATSPCPPRPPPLQLKFVGKGAQPQVYIPSEWNKESGMLDV